MSRIERNCENYKFYDLSYMCYKNSHLIFCHLLVLHMIFCNLRFLVTLLCYAVPEAVWRPDLVKIVFKAKGCTYFILVDHSNLFTYRVQYSNM